MACVYFSISGSKLNPVIKGAPEQVQVTLQKKMTELFRVLPIEKDFSLDIVSGVLFQINGHCYE